MSDAQTRAAALTYARRDQLLDELAETYARIWDESDADTFERRLAVLPTEEIRNNVRKRVLDKRGIALHGEG